MRISFDTTESTEQLIEIQDLITRIIDKRTAGNQISNQSNVISGSDGGMFSMFQEQPQRREEPTAEPRREMFVFEDGEPKRFDTNQLQEQKPQRDDRDDMRVIEY